MPCLDLGADGLETVDDGLTLRVGQHPVAGEHRGMGDGPRDVVPVQSPVKSTEAVKASTKASVGAVNRPPQGFLERICSGIERPGHEKRMKILHATPERGWAQGLEEAVEQEPARGTCFLPDFCRFPVVMGAILSSQLLGITLALASSWQGASFWERLLLLSVHVLTIALLGSATLCALRPLLRRCGDRTAAVLAWLLLVAVAALVTWAAFHLAPVPLRAYLDPEGGLDGLMIRSLGISAILGAMVLRYLYLHHMWRLQVEAEAEARFQKLQARIRPHFLFNSMNTIANLTQTDPGLAEEVVQDLADLFRATLSEAHEGSTLAKELELAYRYLNIEKQRLGERLRVLWDVEELPGMPPCRP